MLSRPAQRQDREEDLDAHIRRYEALETSLLLSLGPEWQQLTKTRILTQAGPASFITLHVMESERAPHGSQASRVHPSHAAEGRHYTQCTARTAANFEIGRSNIDDELYLVLSRD